MRVLPPTARGRVLAVAGLVFAVFLVATARLFVWPPTDWPTRADAVVALGGDPQQRRAQAAIKLARSGYATVAVISLGGKHAAPCPRPVAGLEIVCFRANPLSTRGEAEHVSALAARWRWRRLMVISERSQSTRARLLFKRCTRARVDVVPVADLRPRLLFELAYEWGALAKALVVDRSC